MERRQALRRQSDRDVQDIREAAVLALSRIMEDAEEMNRRFEDMQEYVKRLESQNAELRARLVQARYGEVWT